MDTSVLAPEGSTQVVRKPACDLTRKEKVAYLVQEMAKLEQVPCPVQHHFAPGVYLREIFMPAGTAVIGKIHKTEHLNIIERGAVRYYQDDGVPVDLRAPCTFVSKPGVQKILYIVEDCVWKTIHPTTETDMLKLEQELIEPPPIVEITHTPQEALT